MLISFANFLRGVVSNNQGETAFKFISFGESVLKKLTPVCSVQDSLAGQHSWKLLRPHSVA